MSKINNRIATCMCRSLTVLTKGEPVRVSICHCLECQLRSGSAFSFQARWKNEDIQIKGDYKTFVRTHKEDGDQVRFNFCPQCGSTVFYKIDSMADVTAVAVGGFADPQFPAPHYSVYEDRKHAWITLPDDQMEHFN